MLIQWAESFSLRLGGRLLKRREATVREANPQCGIYRVAVDLVGCGSVCLYIWLDLCVWICVAMDLTVDLTVDLVVARCVCQRWPSRSQCAFEMKQILAKSSKI